MMLTTRRLRIPNLFILIVLELPDSVVGLPEHLLNFSALSRSKFLWVEKLVPGSNQKYSHPNHEKKAAYRVCPKDSEMQITPDIYEFSSDINLGLNEFPIWCKKTQTFAAY